MDIVSKQEAKKQGLKHYFTNKPCKNGHIDQRFISSGGCLTCATIVYKKSICKKIEAMSPKEYMIYRNRQSAIHRAYVNGLPKDKKDDLLKRQRISRKKWWSNLSEEGKLKEKERTRKANAELVKRMSPEEIWRREAYYNAKRRAKNKNLEFDLEKKDMTIPDVCPVFGTPFKCYAKTGRGYQNWDSPSVDRIDNNKGYTKDNIAIISWKANSIKADSTIEELRMIIEWLEKQG